MDTSAKPGFDLTGMVKDEAVIQVTIQQFPSAILYIKCNSFKTNGMFHRV